eukprot:scaffold1517_cov181-Pinguiococcus_pyrenoidosus.AAC.4
MAALRRGSPPAEARHETGTGREQVPQASAPRAATPRRQRSFEAGSPPPDASAALSSQPLGSQAASWMFLAAVTILLGSLSRAAALGDSDIPSVPVEVENFRVVNSHGQDLMPGLSQLRRRGRAGRNLLTDPSEDVTVDFDVEDMHMHLRAPLVEPTLAGNAKVVLAGAKEDEQYSGGDFENLVALYRSPETAVTLSEGKLHLIAFMPDGQTIWLDKEHDGSIIARRQNATHGDCGADLRRRTRHLRGGSMRQQPRQALPIANADASAADAASDPTDARHRALQVTPFTDCYEGDEGFHRFYIGLAMDTGLYDFLGGDAESAVAYLEEIVNDANIIYETQLHIILTIGRAYLQTTTTNAPEWNSGTGDGCPSIQNIHDKFTAWVFSEEEQGVYHLFRRCRTVGTVGIAWRSTLCNRFFKTAVNFHVSDSTWIIFAHEMGHNFGADHSFDEGQGKTGGIMDYGNGMFNGYYQFNEQYTKDEICAELATEVPTCPFFEEVEVVTPGPTATLPPTSEPTTRPAEATGRQSTILLRGRRRRGGRTRRRGKKGREEKKKGKEGRRTRRRGAAEEVEEEDGEEGEKHPNSLGILLESKVNASNVSPGDEFGRKVDIDGSFAIIGARRADTDSGSNAGAAYIYRTYDGLNWVRVASLLEENSGISHRFGAAVAIDESSRRAIVGADKSGDSGAANVFVSDDAGVEWNVVVIQPASLQAGDEFGFCADITDEYAIVGAPKRQTGGIESAGAAFIFQFDADTNVIRTTEVFLDEPMQKDFFGKSVGIDGSIAIVGAPQEDGTRKNGGAIHVYVTSDGGQTWPRITRLDGGQDASNHDKLGSAVAISGGVIIAGAAYRDDFGVSSGSAYIYTSIDGGMSWISSLQIYSPEPDSNGLFGYAVDVDGDVVIVGARREDATGTNSGAAYIFRKDNVLSTWTYQAKLSSAHSSSFDEEGFGVGVTHDAAIVGAPRDAGSGTSAAGAAYIYAVYESSLAVLYESKLSGSDSASGDLFGQQVDIDGAIAVVGASDADTANGEKAGAVFVYKSDHDLSWSQQAKLEEVAPGSSHQFGYSLAVDEANFRLIVGAPGNS